MTTPIPVLAIVGRPNVGKSTLFNRLTGSRRSIVTDEPGITRDRIYGHASWRGRRFDVVDTGGLLPEDKAAMPREILRQAERAIAEATHLVLVADARAGLVPLDAELARKLRTAGKPLFLAANKTDTASQESLSAGFYELGIPVHPISAEHGLGVDDLLDAITRDFPEAGEAEPESPEHETQIAIIGRPNVGKSTLLNQFAGGERSIVSPEPGTTRDAVDTCLDREGKRYRFIDTAGIRRKGKTRLAAEKLSVVMARKHLERADIALLVADASTGIQAGDATIAGYARDSGRSVIIVMNKWDLAIEEAKRARAAGGKRAENTPEAPAKLAAEYEHLIREKLKFLSYAPILFISALRGEQVSKLYGLIDRVQQARTRRISTGELNRWLAGVDLGRGTSPSAHRVKIFYITQASSSPPTFILFTNQRERLHFSYERFLENRLREQFDFTGTPIRFLQRVRERDGRGRRPSRRRPETLEE